VRSYLVLQRGHSTSGIFPLIGITGMMKNRVMNRIAVFSTNGATAPQELQWIAAAVRVEPQANNLVPIIST